MIPAPSGIVARFRHEHDGHTHYSKKPVIAFDDDGHALVLDERRLVPADSYSNFANLKEDDDVDYVALIPAGGWRVEFTSEDGFKWNNPLVGWALKPDGTIDPFASDSTGLVDNFDHYGGEYRIYHPDSEEIDRAPLTARGDEPER